MLSVPMPHLSYRTAILVVFAALAILVGLAELSPAFAQQPASGPAGAEFANQPAGLWQELLQYVRTQQRAFTDQLAGAVRTLRDEDSLAAAWGLVTISFLYGVFHAAGPGHGKAVISTYLLTHPSQLRSGLTLAWIASMVQAITAVVLVVGAVHLFGLALRETREATGPLESASFALVAVLGGWLILRAGRSIHRSFRHHHHDHDPADPTCCDAHGPSAAQIQKLTSWREALPIVLSIGIRPCSGGVLVLLIAEAMGLRIAGISAVFAMAVGTALTVSALALASIFLRKAALYFVRSDGRTVQAAGQLVMLAGGGVIFFLGLALFLDSLNHSAAPVF